MLFIMPTSLVIVLAIASVVASETYYVTPDNGQCPSAHVPCLTLSEYASKGPDYFISNTTMILLSGNHTLESNLSFIHLNALSIVANCSDTSTVLLACRESAMLGFEHISELQIDNISFLDCVETTMYSVDQLTVVNCNFAGSVAVGTGLNLVNVTHGNIIWSSFHLFSTTTSGGALAIGTSSNISISNSTFNHNVAFDGGAVYSESAVAVYNSVFSNNVANHLFGGAVFVQYAPGVTVISNSTFINNSISVNSRGCNGCVGGGAVTVMQSLYPVTTLRITGSVFTNNTAYGAGALGVDEVATSIVNSDFSYNSALYHDGGSIVANRGTLTIDSAVFIGNMAKNIGGAIDAGVTSESEGKSISIGDCIFRENVATTGGAVAITSVLSNVTLYSNYFYGNNASVFGGAIYFYMAVVTMTDTTFIYNVASKGSVLYIRGRGDSSIRSVGLLVHNNTAKLAGSFFVVHCSMSLYGYTEFSENVGSVYVIASNVTFLGHTRMFSNLYNSNTDTGRLEEGGSITSFQSELIFNDVTELERNNATKGGGVSASESTLRMNHNITIKDNTAVFGGGIYLYQSDLYIHGNSCLILNNTAVDGGGIYAVGSSVKLIYGSLHFERNSAKRGGGTFLESNAKLYVIKYRYECDGSFLPSVERTKRLCEYHNKSRYLDFVGNSAEFEGGAIYVTDEASSGVCASTPYATTLPTESKESECFFQSLALYEDPSIVYSSTDVSTLINLANTNFLNNTAKSSGAVLFGGLLDRCTVSPFSEVLMRYLDYAFIPTYDSIKSFYNVTNIKQGSSDLSSHAVRICFCDHHLLPNCDYIPDTITAMKGRTVKVRIAAVDQLNRTVPAHIRAYISSGIGRLGPKQTIQNTSGNCVESLEYNITSPNSSVQLNLYAEGPCKDIGISKSTVEVKFTPCHCSVGFVPAASECYCVCDPKLFPYITECFNENGTLLRQGDFWIDSVDTANGYSGFIISAHCPFDYCHLPAQPVYLNLNDSDGADKQCAFNRSGMLCGACAEGLSLTLGNSHCAPCTNYWLALLVLFALAGVLLVGLLLACNLTVAVGTINGLVFFANIIAANSSIFLPSTTPKIFVLFIAWINLDLGIETCFYDGLDGYAKVWLQFLFPVYLMFLVAMIIWISEHSTRFAKLLIGRNPVATLATLILLSYSKLLRTIIASLSFSRLKYPDNSTETVWLYDANVSYLKGKHVPLFIAAMFILVIGIGYTFFLLLWKWRRYYSFQKTLSWVRNTKVYSFMDAYNAPFNVKHSYWSGLLLLIRGILYLVSSLNVLGDPKINMLCICVVLGVLFIFKEIVTTNNVYKKWALNSLESIFMLNLFLFAVSTLYIQGSNGDQRVLSCISLSVAFVLFLGILVYHTFTFTFPGLQKPIRKLLFRRHHTVNESSQLLGFESSYLKRTPAAELRKPLDLIDDESYDRNNDQSRPMDPDRTNQIQRTPTHSVIDGIPQIN